MKKIVSLFLCLIIATVFLGLFSCGKQEVKNDTDVTIEEPKDPEVPGDNGGDGEDEENEKKDSVEWVDISFPRPGR